VNARAAAPLAENAHHGSWRSQLVILAPSRHLQVIWEEEALSRPSRLFQQPVASSRRKRLLESFLGDLSGDT
jgi:hypothetical protein